MDADQSLAETFVEFADTLVDDFDLIDFLERVCTRCVQLFSVDASGLMLRDRRDVLRILAASSEETRLVELFQLQNAEGPCLDSARTGQQIHADDPDEIERRWPQFGARIRGMYRSVYSLPMRLRSEVIGGLNLFSHETSGLNREDIRIAQALADTATIGIIQQRALHEATLLSEQLQTALNSRILIEQAKGIYAERHRVDMAAAWQALRGSARRHNLPLHQVAEDFVHGRVDLDKPT